MKFEIEGKVAIVTGANRGIGRIITETLLARGASRVYAGVRQTESVADLVELYKDRLIPLKLDIADQQSVKLAGEQASDVELVINNAGILRLSSILEESSLPGLNEQLQVNLYGLIYMAQTFAPILKQNGGGAFVQINSVSSLKTSVGFETYCASKAAAYAITQNLRDRLAEQGTLVVSVHPGPISTDMAVEAGIDEIAEPPELVANSILEALAEGKFHAWPDSMAKGFEKAYQNFAKEIINVAD